MALTDGRVLIVGGGAAGVSAAEALRVEGFQGDVTLFGEEQRSPYDRPPLSKKVLDGSWLPERTALRDPDWYTARDVKLRRGVRAVGVDSAGSLLHLETGDAVPFDALVLATGVRARQLPVTRGLLGVHTVRSLDDILTLKTEMDDAVRVLVIGAGFLGMEIAAVARTAGRDVTVVDPLPVPLGAAFGRRIGELVADLHRRNGVTLYNGLAVASIDTAPDRGGRRAIAATLTDGTIVTSDCTVVAVGAVPELDWLAGSGMRIGNGIECDEHCQAAPNVYAAGDIASWPSARYGRRLRVEHRLNASEQAAAAARNIVHGNSVVYDPVPYFWSEQYDVRLQAHGTFDARGDYDVVEGDIDGGRFLLADRSVRSRQGVIGWNAPKLIAPHARALAANLSVPEPHAIVV